MDYYFRKDRLPRGLSYPLKRSLLDARLASAGITALSGVSYSRGLRNRLVLSASFSSADRKGTYGAGRTSLGLYAVPAEERRLIEELLLAGGLAAVCDWLLAAERAGNVWRANDHGLYLRFAAGRLTSDER